MNRTLAASLAGLSLLALTTQAWAHAHLTGSEPAANVAVPAPRQLALRFSEKLNPKFSGLSLTMPKMGNMAVPVKVSVAPDGKTLLGVPSEVLSPGAYQVSWHAVTADTHRVQGAYAFTVK